MAKAQNMRRARWTCPTCANTVLAPTRPRADDTRRYCLTCSEKKGRLVRRTAPALEKARLMRLEVRKVGKAAGRRAEEAARAAYYTVAGLDLRVEMANMTKALVFKVPHGHRGTLQSHPPTLRVRRHSAVPKTRFGCAREGRWEIMIASYPGITAHDVRETLLHELAHLHVGCAEQHGPPVAKCLPRRLRAGAGRAPASGGALARRGHEAVGGCRIEGGVVSVRYHAAFWGRANGAIGIAHRCNRPVTVEGADVDSVSTRQAAQRALYDTHEHISNVVLTVVSDDDSVPKGAA